MEREMGQLSVVWTLCPILVSEKCLNMVRSCPSKLSGPTKKNKSRRIGETAVVGRHTTLGRVLHIWLYIYTNRKKINFHTHRLVFHVMFFGQNVAPRIGLFPCWW